MPDFRDETIYFVVTDRFCDGDPANNTGKDADFDPTHTDWWKYWGGDLQGLIDKLDYVRGLGGTAIWITPVFDQVDRLVDIGPERMAPYHGYWAKDFKRIDEHLVEDPEHVRVFAQQDTVFDRLVSAMHERGMKLILDIVCNHSNPQSGGGRGEIYDDGKLLASFDQDHGGWYRREGGVEDWNDLDQVQRRDLCGLADFNEESHAYRAYIKDAIKAWLDKGVDALRVDTVKHMPLWFWQEFTGDMLVHRQSTFMFGEWFNGGCWDPASVEFASKSGMTILDFAWRQGIVSALAQRSSRGFADLHDVVAKDHLFRDATELVTFVDNHDVPRFLSISDDRDRFRLAVLLTMVSRGIPCLYYGGEQYLHCDVGGGNDPYNRPMMPGFDPTPFGADIAKLAALRKRSAAVQKGGVRTKWIDADRWVFTRKFMGSTCVVAANRSDAPAEVEVHGLELPDGTHDEVLGGPALELRGGRAMVRIPPRGLAVWSQDGGRVSGRAVVDLQIHGVTTEPGEDVYVCGDAPELGDWDVARAVALEYVNRSTWAVALPLGESAGRDIHYKYLVRRGATFAREPGLGHHRRAPSSDHAIWRDDWHR